MRRPLKRGDRTEKEVREHYEIEEQLATQLRNAPKQERRHLYASLYNELFRRVPHHPQLTRKVSALERKRMVEIQMQFLRPFLTRDTTFLEVGPGDCSLSLEVAKIVRQVYAVDVSGEITALLNTPSNFRLVLSDGSSIPVPPGSVRVAYSHQLIEHLHPDDVIEHLESIYQALDDGGVYICVTPNRLDGPHDVSRYFKDVASGFHLKEYTTSELSRLFRSAGFSRIRCLVGARGRFITLPELPIVLYEALLERLPPGLRRSVVEVRPFGLLLSIRVVGTK